MKKLIKTLAIFALAAIMMTSLAACGSTDAPGDDAQAGPDLSAYPAEFDSCTINDVQTYLTDCGLLGNEKFLLMPLSSGDVEVINASGGFMYMDAEAASVVDIVYAFDASDADSQAALDSIIETKSIMLDGNPVAQMDAVLGQFAFSYTGGTDDAHISAFTQAIVDLGAHYGVEPAYLPEG